MFTGIDLIPPATAVNYVPYTLFGFVFQYMIRRRHFAFWAKYNCKHTYNLVSTVILNVI